MAFRWPWTRSQTNSYQVPPQVSARVARVQQAARAWDALDARRGRTAADSGMVTRYQPAQHVKSGRIAGLIQSISKMVGRAFGTIDPLKTTEQGAASAASPTTYALSLYQLRYERRDMITDCRQMIIDDPRARRATVMFAAESTREGCTITVKRAGKSKARGTIGRTYRVAEECARTIERLYNPKSFAFEWMRVVEGDLFVQAIVEGDNIVGIKRMPASSMERNTDDTDSFIDPVNAFSQVDVTTSAEVATFPLALMYHGRWNHIDGERYGTPEAIAGRRYRRLLELQEDSQAVRRMTRAAQKRLWSIGNKDNPGGDEALKKFREENGMVAGRQEIFDPTNVATDVFSNGLIDVKTADGDANLDAIADLKYAQNVYSMALPTPAALMGLDSESINRDVLTEIYEQWLKDTARLTDAAKELVVWLVDLQLLLKGILPEAVKIDVHFSESSTESRSEVVKRILDLRQNIIGGGKEPIPDPLISRLHALQLLADIIDVEDAEEELKAIEAELEELRERAASQEAESPEAEASEPEDPEDAPKPGKRMPGRQPRKQSDATTCVPDARRW